MNIEYKNKEPQNTILHNTRPVTFSNFHNDAPNKLIYGENTSVLYTLINTYNMRNKVDLVYIDPPFATNNTFTVGNERVSTISNSKHDPVAYSDNILGMDFLEFLRKRLVLLRDIMSDEGSIYLHIDYKIGHYVKIIMDEIFGIENFRNDITRIKCNPKNFQRKSYGNIKDMILFYSKTKKYIWNDIKENITSEDKIKRFSKTNIDGRKYTTIPLHAPGETKNGSSGMDWNGINPPIGRHWRVNTKILDEWQENGLIEWSKNNVPRKKIFADEVDSKKIQDIWEFKDPQYPKYPTEKNINLLKRIIQMSSNENSTVLDCFCGSGTTLVASAELGRKWIGIDASNQAIDVCKKRLSQNNGMFINYDYEFIETT